MIKTYDSRIDKRDLSKEINSFLYKQQHDYSAILVTALSLIKKENDNKKLDKEDDIQEDTIINDSIFLQLRNRFPDISIYIINSALNEATGLVKSAKSLNKNNITITKERIAKKEKKLYKTVGELKTYLDIKDKLKSNCYPFSKKSKKYTITPENKVVITFNTQKKNKKKDNKDNVIIYDNLYLFEVQYLDKKIKTLKTRVNNIAQSKYKLETKLKKINSKTYFPNITIGGKKLYKQSLISKSKRKEYNLHRHNRFTVSGRLDSKVGNYVFNYNCDTKQLIITLNKQEYIIDNVVFPYGFDNIVKYYNEQSLNYNQSGSNRKPITFTVIDKGTHYNIKCVVDVDKPRIVNYDTSTGVIGVDTNLGFYAVTVTNKDGNPIQYHNINYDWLGKTSNQVKYNIEQAVCDLVNIAVKEHKPIVIENIKIKGSKKISDYNDNKSKNFSCNMFAYEKMLSALKNRAIKCGVEVFTVNPAYTSFIGKVKFMPYYKQPVHTMAALAIARRLQHKNEKLPRKYNRYSWKTLYNKKQLNLLATKTELQQLRKQEIETTIKKIKKKQQAKLVV